MTVKTATRLDGVEKSLIRKLFDGAGAGSINLGLGEPQFQTPEPICREAIRFIEKGHVHYTPNAGLVALRKAVAGFHGGEAEAEKVCVTCGSEEALFVALMCLVDSGDEVLMPDPCFVSYPNIVRMAGGKPVFYRMPAKDGFAFDQADFKKKITPKTKIVILCSPSNPTGHILTEDDLTAIADSLAGSDCLVFSDEIYRELYFSEEPRSISAMYPQTLILSGLSKSCAMTGWRLGWAYGDPEIIEAMTVMHQYVAACASSVSQQAALAAFTPEGMEGRRKMRLDLLERRDFILDLIDSELGLERVSPDGGFYVMLDVSAFGSSMEVADKLLEEGVITVPGSAFGAEGEGFLRLSFATDFETIREGIGRMKGFFGG